MDIIERFVCVGLSTKSEATKRAYRYTLIRLHKYLHGIDGSLENLTRDDIRDYIAYLRVQKKAKLSSVYREFAAISMFADWSQQSNALDNIYIPKQEKANKVAAIPLNEKKLKKIIRFENRLLAKIYRKLEPEDATRDVSISMLIRRIGLKVNEIVELNIEDLRTVPGNILHSTLTINRGKGNRQREILLPSDVNYMIWRYLQTRKDGCPALFTTRSGEIERLSVRSVQQILKKFGTNARELRQYALNVKSEFADAV